MYARHRLVSAGTLLVSAWLFAQEEISLDQLPSPARRTLDQSAPNEPVKKISREAMAGRSIYLVELEREHAINPHLRIAETGELLPEPPVPAETSVLVFDPATSAPDTRVLGLADLPPGVQDTIQREAAGRPISNIDIKRQAGSVVYGAEIRDPQSGRVQLQIDVHGQILEKAPASMP